MPGCPLISPLGFQTDTADPETGDGIRFAPHGITTHPNHDWAVRQARILMVNREDPTDQSRPSRRCGRRILRHRQRRPCRRKRTAAPPHHHAPPSRPTITIAEREAPRGLLDLHSAAKASILWSVRMRQSRPTGRFCQCVLHGNLLVRAFWGLGTPG